MYSMQTSVESAEYAEFRGFQAASDYVVTKMKNHVTFHAESTKFLTEFRGLRTHYTGSVEFRGFHVEST